MVVLNGCWLVRLINVSFKANATHELFDGSKRFLWNVECKAKFKSVRKNNCHPVSIAPVLARSETLGLIVLEINRFRKQKNAVRA